VTQESARPYFAFNAFYAAERAYGRMFNPLNAGDVLVPSPLLTQVSTNILLHFQFDPEGRLTSPQVPEGNQRDLAEAQFTTHERVEAAAARLRTFRAIMSSIASPDLARLAGARIESNTRGAPPESGGSTDAPLNRDVLFSAAPAPGPDGTLSGADVAPLMNPLLHRRLQSSISPGDPPATPAQQQILRKDGELQKRAESVRQNLDLDVMNVLASYPPAADSHVLEGVVKPLWFDDSLILVRRVIVQGGSYVQGCWLDWPSLREWLLNGVQDILPDAHLEPLNGNGSESQARLLATLPIHLVPGIVTAGLDEAASPIRLALVLGWVCVLVAGIAVALLLQGTLSLM